MAPSNLNQVFVMNNNALATGGVFNTVDGTAAYSTLAVSANRGGVWTRPLATGTQVYTVAALFGGNTGAPVAPLGMTTDFFQVVQGTNKSLPIATPLISPKDVRRIKATTYTATTLHAQGWTFPAIPAAVAGDNGSWMVKCDIRVAPTFYEMFSNPSNGNLDLSVTPTTGGGKIFPLLGNFSAGRTMIPIVEIPAGTSAANAATLVYNAIINNATLNNLFYFSAAPTTGAVTVTARHPGVIFDIAIFDTVSKASDVTLGATIATTGFNAGNGNYWQVISAEKSQRARYGNFNRMYFPFEQPNYAQVGTQYASIEVSYEHNWPSSTGIARAGELNNFTIYAPTALGTYGTVFGTGAASSEFNY